MGIGVETVVSGCGRVGGCVNSNYVEFVGEPFNPSRLYKWGEGKFEVQEVLFAFNFPQNLKIKLSVTVLWFNLQLDLPVRNHSLRTNREKLRRNYSLLATALTTLIRQ